MIPLYLKEIQKNKHYLLSGALVDNKSYSIWANKLAKAGYTVYLIKEPLNLAVFNPDKASSIIKTNKINNYVVGGHSLGGVITSRFAEKEYLIHH